jgi:hypothetical protein
MNSRVLRRGEIAEGEEEGGATGWPSSVGVSKVNSRLAVSGVKVRFKKPGFPVITFR